MKTFVLIAIIFVPFFAFAQEGEIPEDVLKELSQDLAELHEQVLKSQENLYWTNVPPMYKGWQFAQEFTVTGKATQVRAGADLKAEAILTAHLGQTYRIVDKVEGWYAVVLDKPTKDGLNAGWLGATEGVPSYTSYDLLVASSQQRESITDRAYNLLIESVAKFKKKYKDNPYFSITGFSIEVGIPPSVSVDFEFK